MKRIKAVIGAWFLPVIFIDNGTNAFAQEASGVEERIPLDEAQLSEPDEGADYVGPPPLRDGQINASPPSSEIEKRLPETRAPGKAAEDTLEAPPPPALRERPANAFVLTAVEISGATAFPMEKFAPLYDDMLARTITVEDVAKIVDAITAAYRKEGYFLSRATAPAQTAEGGVLYIEVAEGYLANVTVNGEADDSIKRRLRKLMEERPLRLSTLEKALALTGDLKGVSVKSTEIEPDPLDLARHRLIVTVEQDALEASVYADNRGTDAAGPYQVYARAAANSILRTGDQLSVGVFTIPDDPGELALAEVAYQLPLLGAGTYAGISGAVSKFDAGASLATIDTETRTKRLAFSLSHPIIRKRKTSLWANVGFEGRNIEEEQLGVLNFDDKIRVASAWTNFRRDHWNGYTTVYGKASRGVDMFGATVDETSLSRPDANGEFTKFEVQISRYQNIGKVFGLYASFAGQTSLDPLLASEEFSLGGARFGRAYDYGELTGDDGVATLVELRYGRDPNIPFLDFYQFYGFYDYGAVWNDNAAPGFEKLSLSSAGGGLRLTFPSSIYATVEIAKPLDHVPFTQGDRDWRGFFSVSKSF